jgi:hypothetical protein
MIQAATPMNTKLFAVGIGIGDSLIAFLIAVIFLSNWWLIAAIALVIGIISSWGAALALEKYRCGE